MKGQLWEHFGQSKSKATKFRSQMESCIPVYGFTFPMKIYYFLLQILRSVTDLQIKVQYPSININSFNWMLGIFYRRYSGTYYDSNFWPFEFIWWYLFYSIITSTVQLQSIEAKGTKNYCIRNSVRYDVELCRSKCARKFRELKPILLVNRKMRICLGNGSF